MQKELQNTLSPIPAKKKREAGRIAVVILAVLVILLELLPYGAVLRFGSPDGIESVHYTSYFDLTPYGYANFGPFFTALLSVAIFILSFFPKRGCTIAALVCNVSAFLTSLLPLIMYGPQYYSLVGGLISLVLAGGLVVRLVFKKAANSSSAQKHHL